MYNFTLVLFHKAIIDVTSMHVLKTIPMHFFHIGDVGRILWKRYMTFHASHVVDNWYSIFRVNIKRFSSIHRSCWSTLQPVHVHAYQLYFSRDDESSSFPSVYMKHVWYQCVILQKLAYMVRLGYYSNPGCAPTSSDWRPYRYF